MLYRICRQRDFCVENAVPLWSLACEVLCPAVVRHPTFGNGTTDCQSATLYHSPSLTDCYASYFVLLWFREFLT